MSVIPVILLLICLVLCMSVSYYDFLGHSVTAATVTAAHLENDR